MTEGQSVERMADGIVRLLTELARRKDPSEPSTHELTTSQAQTVRLVILDGPQRVGSLAKQLGVTMATASRTVDALVNAGLVRREQDPQDARAVRVVLTARGRREHQVRYRRFVRALERLSDELSEVERRQLADALETLGRLFVAEPEAQVGASAGRPKS
ncbi:MAG TPA: MarR family transcriptional regulator [Gaiellaceae bacterium]